MLEAELKQLIVDQKEYQNDLQQLYQRLQRPDEAAQGVSEPAVPIRRGRTGR